MNREEALGRVSRIVEEALDHYREPPFPFLEEIRIDYLPRGDSFEILLRFHNGGELRTLIYVRRGWDGQISTGLLTSMIRAAYLDRGDYRSRGYRMMAPMTITPARYGLTGDVEAEFLDIHTESWREAAERHERTRQERREREARWNDARGIQRGWDMVRPYRNDEEAIANWRRMAVMNYVTLSTRRAHSAEAVRRGRTLLLENLTPDQRECYEKEGFFDVTGNAIGKLYRILHGTHTNMIQSPLSLADRKKILCVVPVGNLVYGDVLLSQKLAVELEEEKMLTEAIVSYRDKGGMVEMMLLAKDAARLAKEAYDRGTDQTPSISSHPTYLGDAWPT